MEIQLDYRPIVVSGIDTAGNPVRIELVKMQISDPDRRVRRRDHQRRALATVGSA